MQDIGFDLISDLNLTVSDSFDWNDKVTSLYCIVAGNISTDIDVVFTVLDHLSTLYQGVFFVPGRLEYDVEMNFSKRTRELAEIVDCIPNLCLLHQHVAVVDGIAVVGANGWGNIHDKITVESIVMSAARLEDFSYLRSTVSKLQRHLDIKKMIIVTSAVPHDDLYFHEKEPNMNNQIPLYECLDADTEKKVTHWVFGTHLKTIDTRIDGINFVNNPKSAYAPYWPKRITLSV